MRHAVTTILFASFLGTALAAPPPAPAPKADTIAVLKITRDIRVLATPVVAFESCADPAKRKEALLKEAQDAHKKWEADEEAFRGDKANKGREFVELEPEAVSVSVAKEHLTQAEADAYVKEATEKALRWDVVRFTDCHKRAQVLAMEPSKIRAKMTSLLDEFRTRYDAWQKQMQAPPPHGGGPPPPVVTRPTKPKAEKAVDKDFTTQKEAEEAAKGIK